MKELIGRIYNRPKTGTYLSWIKLFAITGSAQLLVQVFGFISGIIVLRILPISEYALYTLANTMLGTMTVLADGGVAAGTMASGAKVWKDKEKLGTVMASAMYLRKRFAIVSLLVAIPLLIYLLRHHHASWIMTVLIVLSLIPAFFAAISDSILEIVPKLWQDIPALQKNQVSVNMARLAMLGLTLFIFPWTAVAILSSGLPRIWGNFKLRSVASKYADKDQQPDAEIKKEILVVVKRILPTSIYYCISGQITIWIISIFGSTTAVGQVGGLGRLSMMFTIFSTLFATLIGPRFARLPSEKSLITKRFIIIQALLFGLCAFLLLFIYIFSKEFLWVLGKSFSGLTKELMFVAIGGSIGLISSSTNQLLTGRSLVVPPVLFISCTIAVQIIIAFILPLNNIIGVLEYGILTTAAIYLIRIFYFFITLRRNENYL
ncbi:MAG: polysaccharide biosynthesis protein [Ferruginibacter sp.]